MRKPYGWEVGAGATSPIMAFHVPRGARVACGSDINDFIRSIPAVLRMVVASQIRDDMGARARTVRVRPSWSVWQRARAKACANGREDFGR
jgi:hypothetical protein